MGLKLTPSKSILNVSGSPLLNAEVFMNHCKYFQWVKQDIQISRRVISGLVQNENGGSLSLSSFTLFWELFISRTAKIEEKALFLVYFLLPAGQEKVDLDVIRLVLEFMCRELPAIERLDLKTEMLSD